MAIKKLGKLIILSLFFIATGLSSQTVTTLTSSFNGSGGVSVDEAGNIYVADFGALLNNANGTTISKVLRDGSRTVFATGLAGASGNAFDSQGNLFQSNIAGNRISKITPDGNVSTFATTNISNPVGIAIDSEDNVYVANCRAPGQIIKLTSAGVSSILVTSNLMSCPNGLTIDDSGNLYTANFNNGNVIKVTPEGNPSILVSIPGGGNGHLTFANDMLYVVSRSGNQIHKVTLSGERTLLAGTGTCGKADGPALQATFSFPNGIAASPDGDTLYVNDAVPLCNANLNPVVVRMITGVKEQPTSVGDPGASLPRQFILNQNYPNPFNPETKITYELPANAQVFLKIHNLLGEEVRTLVSFVQTAGLRTVIWDGKDNAGRSVSSGVYLYRLQIGEVEKIMRMVLLR